MIVVTIKGVKFETEQGAEGAEGIKALAILSAKDGAAPEYSFLTQEELDNLDNTRCLTVTNLKGKPIAGFKADSIKNLPWSAPAKAPKTPDAKAPATTKKAAAKPKAPAKKATKPQVKATKKPAAKAKAAPKVREGVTASSIILDQLRKGTTRPKTYAALKKAFPKKTEVALKNTMGSLMHTLPIRHKMRIRKTKIDKGTAETGRWLYKAD